MVAEQSGERVMLWVYLATVVLVVIGLNYDQWRYPGGPDKPLGTM